MKTKLLLSVVLKALYDQTSATLNDVQSLECAIFLLSLAHAVLPFGKPLCLIRQSSAIISLDSVLVIFGRGVPEKIRIWYLQPLCSQSILHTSLVKESMYCLSLYQLSIVDYKLFEVKEYHLLIVICLVYKFGYWLSAPLWHIDT